MEALARADSRPREAVGRGLIDAANGELIDGFGAVDSRPRKLIQARMWRSYTSMAAGRYSGVLAALATCPADGLPKRVSSPPGLPERQTGPHRAEGIADLIAAGTAAQKRQALGICRMASRTYERWRRA